MKYPQLVSMPSAVSDWLEEQLEARGIDAVVYTRYILSLLHTDSVDVILPDDEEFYFSQLKKETIKRSHGSRGGKRYRRPAIEWWKKNGQADPDKIKRLAAVECLMSASDQTFGIESLVDELCEKLKTVNRQDSPPPQTTTVDPTLSNFDLQQQKQQNCVISRQELANRYYAAFPPLTRNNSPTKLISLVPKWIPSPIKQNKQSNNRRNHNKDTNIVNMKARSTVVGNKQRFYNYLNRNNDNNNNNNKKDIGKNIMKSVEGINQLDLSLFINNNKNNSKLTNIINDWPKTIAPPLSTTTTTATTEHCLNNVWNIEDDLNMYEDLPVDISELLDDSSPPPPTTLQNDNDNVELMNIANMRDTGTRGFIQNGTNLTTSIWSNDDITSEFGSITINSSNNWNMNSDGNNDNNNRKQDVFYEENWDYILPEKWSEIDDNNSCNPITLSLMKLNHNQETSPFVEVCPKPKSQQYNPFKQTTTNLLHNTPVRTIEIDSANKDDLLTSTHSHFRPIKETINQHHHHHHHHNNNNNNNSNNYNHLQQYEYSDGTTFTISRNFEQINYRRTKSGGLYLENDYAMKRKYYEYHNNNSNSNLTTVPTTQSINNSVSPPQQQQQTKKFGLILKFIVCQNDKQCQTDDIDFIVDVTKIEQIFTNNMNKESYHNNNNNKNSNNDNKNGTIVPFKCTCLANHNKSIQQQQQQAMITDYSLGFIVCPLHPQQNDKNNSKLMAEIIWDKQDNNNINNSNNNNNNKGGVCEKCTKSVMWNTECMANFDCNDDGIWDAENLRNIWSGGEVCHSCLGRPPSTIQQTKLREDISRLGEQLLSDLDSIQRSYMESNELSSSTLSSTNMETSYDINELINTNDKKRRHSLIMAINNNTNNSNNNNHNININNNNNNNNDNIDESGIWSFASRLAEDCLIQMSTIPTLRSVTL